MKDNELIFESIAKVVKAASFVRIQSVLQDKDTECINENFPHLMPGEWVSLILLSSNDLRIFFKIFFDLDSLVQVLNEKQEIRSSLKLDENTMKDFMKEYCNLVGGYINGTLEKLEIQTSMSLPLALKGFDDFFFPYPDNIASFEKNWVLRCSGRKFYCSCFVEIIDFRSLDIFKNFTHDEFEIKEGDVDFL
jgi:hypothetical protein